VSAWLKLSATSRKSQVQVPMMALIFLNLPKNVGTSTSHARIGLYGPLLGIALLFYAKIIERVG
jgi:hypothetical protein